ncbi:MAG: hypothetical protein F7C32_03915 [Desulfurococcales archaeon]|nr:hypothetical protein [Desulfurococcales archaeon]
MEKMHISSYRLAAILLLSILLLPSFASLATASAHDRYVTLIVEIDKSSFNAKAVEALNGKVVYMADLAPVAILKVPGKAVGLVAHLSGVLHVSHDGMVMALSSFQTGIGVDKSKPAKPPKGP